MVIISGVPIFTIFTVLSKTGVISMVAVPEGVRHMMLSEELAITARGPFGVKVLHERHQIHEPLLAVHSMLIVGKTRPPYVFTFILEVVRPNSEYPFLLKETRLCPNMILKSGYVFPIYYSN